MNNKTLVAVSYCAEHVKSTGHINPHEHTKMLSAVVNQFVPNYPVLVAATAWTIIDIQERDTRLLTWDIFKKARVVSLRHNPAHQFGACWCLWMALEYASVMGYEYLFFTADDVVVQPGDFANALARLQQGWDYVGANWGGDPHTYNTQVFGCRVEPLYRTFNPEEFQQCGLILERYVYELAKRTGMRGDTSGIPYMHTHDPAFFFELMAGIH